MVGWLVGWLGSSLGGCSGGWLVEKDGLLKKELKKWGKTEDRLGKSERAEKPKDKLKKKVKEKLKNNGGGGGRGGNNVIFLFPPSSYLQFQIFSSNS